MNWWNDFSKEYMEYILMKEIYHCTPTELDKQSEYRTNLDFQLLMLERKKEYIDSKRQSQKAT